MVFEEEENKCSCYPPLTKCFNHARAHLEEDVEGLRQWAPFIRTQVLRLGGF